MKKDKFLSALQFVYLLILLRLILFKYPVDSMINTFHEWKIAEILKGLKSANFIPFHSIRMYMKYFHRIGGMENLVGNIAVFIPMGFLMSANSEDYVNGMDVLIRGAFLSVCIEVVQLLTRLGAFDIDDIILNTFGTFLGFCFFFVVAKVFRRR